MNINKTIRQDLLDFKEYVPSPSVFQISAQINKPTSKIAKLDSGENPYVLDKKYYLYPDPLCVALREKLANYCGVAADCIVCGNGSDELIDLAIRLFAAPQEEIIICPPTFPMYSFYGKLNRAIIKPVLRRKNLQVDTESVFNAITPKTKLIFIDSPGNPTSVVFPQSDLMSLLEKDVLVVMDEAYFEYGTVTAVPLLKKYKNLIILRSFSKWAGLAGLRIGYMIANPFIIQKITAIKPPYNVNAVAQKVAEQILEDKKSILKRLKQITEYRNEACAWLSSIPQLNVFPSRGAYLLFQVKESSDALKNYLRKNGVLVKKIDEPGLRNAIRMNVCAKEEVQKIILLIRRFYEN